MYTNAVIARNVSAYNTIRMSFLRRKHAELIADPRLVVIFYWLGQNWVNVRSDRSDIQREEAGLVKWRDPNR